MTPRSDTVAGLAEDVGKALLQFAERLRAADEPTADRAGTRSATRIRSSIGGTQAKLLEALEAAGTDGLTTAEVAAKTGVAPTNAPRALRALVDRGLVAASDGTPTVWRASESEPAG